mgnify:CR=1 FL=1
MNMAAGQILAVVREWLADFSRCLESAEADAKKCGEECGERERAACEEDYAVTVYAIWENGGVDMFEVRDASDVEKKLLHYLSAIETEDVFIDPSCGGRPCIIHVVGRRGVLIITQGMPEL